MTHDPQSRFRRRLRRRLQLLGVLAVLWVSVLGFRLYQVQVLKGPDYLRLSAEQQKGFIELNARRGEILDRSGSALAASVPVETICAHPPQVENPQEAARKLAPILQMEAAELASRLSSQRGFVYVARKVNPQTAQQVLDLELPGIFTQPESRRYYPSRGLAAHVLGFVGDDGQGLSGLEYQYQDQLAGEKVRVNVKVDALRRRYESEKSAAGTRGNDLVLTLDKGLQFIAEQVLEETVNEHRAKSGSAVLLDPESGAVLAMASYPGFNPNDYAAADPEDFRNLAVRAIYEPGSTFKILTLAAVVNEGLVEPGELIDCEVGNVVLGGKVYREASYKSYGVLSFDQIVAKSSNVGTIQLTLRLGQDGLYRYLTDYGFGRQTGIELPGEEAGILRSPDRWSKLSIGALSIGQEVGVTPLQVVSAVSAVANGGFKVRPYLVDRVVSSAGRVVWQSEQKRRRILRRHTADRMKEALQSVVEHGTGRSSQLDGYTSAGKTGTAQKFINGAYSTSKYVPSFVGFAPAKRPLLAGVVVIDEPQGKYYATDVAAPAFRKMMQRALIHLRVPEDAPRESGSDSRLRLASAREHSRPGGLYNSAAQGSLGSEAPLRQASAPPSGDASPEPSGSEPLGAEARAFSPGPGSRSPEAFQVPDFSGLSLREVLSRSSRLGLRLKAVGRGVAVTQSPRPGRYAQPGSTFEVHFSQRGPREDRHAIEGTHVAGSGGHRP
ncbi:MAG TPA: penicillin-binding protein [Acidobacteriota bacterium]|nr:penicillin-binding protein [Acidobacteriota bacterium]